MATLQICYRDSSGKVVCKDSTVSSMTAASSPGGSDKPKKKQVKDAVDSLVDAMLADTPEYFALVYAPDGVQTK
ncbi:MAG TPA: hypothetical protein VFY20_13575 [Gemmatimonadales bacterium]|nr:hypothetical protein [Gemmatimonadales bacterium]